MNKKVKRRNVPVTMAVWILGGIGALLAFVITAYLRYLYFRGYADEFYRTNYLVFDGTSMLEGATLSAMVITLVAAIQSMIQTRAANRQVQLLTETTRLNDMDAILGAFRAHYAEHGADTQEFYLLAHLIAIGATNVPGQFDTFKRDLRTLMNNLGEKCHLAYMKMELTTATATAPRQLNEDSRKRVRRFYKSKGVTNNSLLEAIIRETEALHIAAVDSKADYHPINDPQKLLPHMILFNPHAEHRFALLWNIDITQSAGGGRNVIASGFATKNPHIIETMLTIFRSVTKKFYENSNHSWVNQR